MLALALSSLVSVAPLGPCPDAPECTVQVQGEPEPALRAALALLDLKLADAPAAAPLARLGGDRAFALEVAAEARAVRVRVRSLHRGPEVYGQATQAVAATRPAFAARARTAAYRVALERAFADLDARVREALGQGVRRLRLSLRVNGLGADARRFVEEHTLACLKGRLDLVGPVTAPVLRGGYLEEELEYAPAQGEPRDPLAFHEGWVRAALLDGPRAPCTLQGTPLARHAVRISADALNGGVTVAFER